MQIIQLPEPCILSSYLVRIIMSFGKERKMFKRIVKSLTLLWSIANRNIIYKDISNIHDIVNSCYNFDFSWLNLEPTLLCSCYTSSLFFFQLHGSQTIPLLSCNNTLYNFFARLDIIPYHILDNFILIYSKIYEQKV